MHLLCLSQYGDKEPQRVIIPLAAPVCLWHFRSFDNRGCMCRLGSKQSIAGRKCCYGRARHLVRTVRYCRSSRRNRWIPCQLDSAPWSRRRLRICFFVQNQEFAKARRSERQTSWQNYCLVTPRSIPLHFVFFYPFALSTFDPRTKQPLAQKLLPDEHPHIFFSG